MSVIATYWKYLRYGLGLGVGLTAAGVVAGVLTSWPPVAIALLVSGLILIGLWILLWGQAKPELWTGRAWQSNTNALVATGAVLVILASVNLLSVRYGGRVDLSENQRFTLAPESQALVSNLTTPATVWIFDVAPNANDRQLLESYRQVNDRFQYRYVDPNLDVVQAQQFNVRNLGEVYLEIDGDRQLVQRLDQAERLSEQKVTNRLAQMVGGEPLTIDFLVGHGEFNVDDPQGGLAGVRAALEQKNYQVRSLDLALTGTIPTDSDVVVSIGPQQAFFPPEIEALTNFLNQGKGLLLLIDPNTDPGLSGWLADWGVTLADQIVLDTSGRGQILGLGPGAPVITNYGNHPITQAFGQRRSFYPIARPLQITPTDAVSATPLLLTGTEIQAGIIADEGIQVDPNQAVDEPLTLGVALSRPVSPAPAPTETDPAPTPSPTPAPTSAVEARLVVIGNATFATDGVFEQQINGDVLLNSVVWLGQTSDATLSIRPREATNRRIFMSLGQQLLLGFYAWFVLPIAGIALAIAMWWRRR